MIGRTHYLCNVLFAVEFCADCLGMETVPAESHGAEINGVDDSI
jgi:hypothetical protein